MGDGDDLHEEDAKTLTVQFFISTEEEYEEEIVQEVAVPQQAPASPTRRWTKPQQAPAAPASPTKMVHADIHQAKGALRKAPMSIYQQRDAEKATQAAAVSPYRPAPKLSAPPTGPREVRKPKMIRAPPEKGGKPNPRTNDIGPAPKVAKKNPLSRLLARNQNSTAVAAPSTSAPAISQAAPPAQKIAATVTTPEASPATGDGSKKKKTIKRLVRKKKPAVATAAAPAGTYADPAATAQPKIAAVAANAAAPKAKIAVPPKFQASPAGAKPSTPAPGGPFKRRVIPNVQPSPPGEETFFEKMLGPKLITNPKMSKCSTRGCLKDQELIGLYVSANWKSDCKRFGPLLKDFYYSAAPHNNLEIVYISADRSLAEFKDYYTTTPFLAMPAGTSSYKNEITKTMKIIEMPALVILDEDGDVVTVEGVQKIQELERGNVEQANQLVERWKRTRPIPIGEVQKDNTLLHGTIDRGFVYWN